MSDDVTREDVTPEALDRHAEQVSEAMTTAGAEARVVTTVGDVAALIAVARQVRAAEERAEVWQQQAARARDDADAAGQDVEEARRAQRVAERERDAIRYERDQARCSAASAERYAQHADRLVSILRDAREGLARANSKSLKVQRVQERLNDVGGQLLNDHESRALVRRAEEPHWRVRAERAEAALAEVREDAANGWESLVLALQREESVRACHTEVPDDPRDGSLTHCRADLQTWPCQTVAALDAGRADQGGERG